MQTDLSMFYTVNNAHFVLVSQPKYGFTLGKLIRTSLSINAILDWTFSTDFSIAGYMVDVNEGKPKKSTKRQRK